MQFAVKALCKGELIFIAEGLVTENEHAVFVHTCPYLGKYLGIMCLAKIDALHFGVRVLDRFLATC